MGKSLKLQCLGSTIETIIPPGPHREHGLPLPVQCPRMLHWRQLGQQVRPRRRCGDDSGDDKTRSFAVAAAGSCHRLILLEDLGPQE